MKTTPFLKKLAALSATAMIAIAPLAASSTAQADPPDHAPAWGYRNKDKDKHRYGDRDRRRGHDRDWRRDRDDDDDDWRRDRDRRRHRDRDGRWDRDDDWRRDRRWPGDWRRDRDNDGRWDRNDRRWPGDWNRNSNTLSGTVLRDTKGDAFDLRADNGRTIHVRLSISEPSRLSEGDRVTLRGTFTGDDDFNAHSLSFLRDR